MQDTGIAKSRKGASIDIKNSIGSGREDNPQEVPDH